MTAIKTTRDFIGICRYKTGDGYTMGFGKYKGLPLTEVPESYFQWAEEQLTEKDKQYILETYDPHYKKRIRCLKMNPQQTFFNCGEVK